MNEDLPHELRLALELERDGAAKEAEGNFSEALICYLRAAHAHAFLGRKTAAVHLYRKILDIDPSIVSAQQELSALASEGPDSGQQPPI